MDKQIKKYCEGLDCAICNEKEPCIYKIANELEEKLKAKEQECEAYKMEAEEGIEINAELKAENETKQKALELQKSWIDNLEFQRNKLKQALSDIKEVAKEKAIVNDWLALEILQIISEVEDE